MGDYFGCLPPLSVYYTRKIYFGLSLEGTCSLRDYVMIER